MSRDGSSMMVRISGSKVSADELGNFLKSFQNLTYNIAEAVEDIPARRKGAFESKIKKKYLLFLSDLQFGSVNMELSSFGGDERVLADVRSVLGVVNRGRIGELEERFSPLRGKRIAKSLYGIYDAVEENKLSIEFQNTRPIVIEPERKREIEEFLGKPYESKGKKIRGRIIQLRVDSRRTVLMDTPQGRVTINYSKETEEEYVAKFKQYLNGFVEITGKYDGLHERLKVDSHSLSSFRELNTDLLGEYLLDGEAIPLRNPVEFMLGFDKETEEYSLSNEELEIFAYDKRLSGAYQEAKKDMGVLWKEYVSVDESALTKDAISLRKFLIKRLAR